MNNQIVIQNKGEIEVDALSLMGATTKDGESTIGMFGSGNKYALALLLREQVPFRIFSGLDEIKVTTNVHKFRNNEFNVMYIDGHKTSITTETGRLNWMPWMAVREFYSNALDEGDAKIHNEIGFNPEVGKTKIHIDATHDKMMEVVANIRKYFPSSGSILYENELGKIYSKYIPQTTCIYRRGILADEFPDDSCYDYDLMSLQLDENRRSLYTWSVYEKLWEFVFSIEDEVIIKEIIDSSSRNTFEGNISSAATIRNEKGEVFTEVTNKMRFAPKEYAGLIEEDKRKNYTLIPKKLYTAICGEKTFESLEWLNDVGLMKEVELNDYERVTVNKAVDFLKECDFKVHGDMKFAYFEDNSVLGHAKIQDKTFYVSQTAIEKGVNAVVSTIIEESIHIKSGHPDKTREFQNSLIDELITYMKKKNAYII